MHTHACTNTRVCFCFAERVVQEADSIKAQATDQHEIDEMKEIYDELKGSSSILTVEDFKSWGDLLDMIEDGSFDMKVLDDTLSKVGVTDVLEFDQFEEVLIF